MTLINCPIGPGDEMIVPGNLEGACNMVSSIGAVEGKTCRSMCDIWSDSDCESKTNIMISSLMGPVAEYMVMIPLLITSIMKHLGCKVTVIQN